MTPGIMPNGLFWTGQIPKVSFRYGSGWAHLKVKDYPMVESYVFGGPFTVHGTCDIDIRWRAKGPTVDRGKGNDVDSADPAAFLGQFREAKATGQVTGSRPGLDFTAKNLSSIDYYGSIGPMKNGSYLL